MSSPDLLPGDAVYVPAREHDTPEWEAYQAAVVSTVTPNGTVFVQVPARGEIIESYERGEVLSSAQFFEKLAAGGKPTEEKLTEEE